MVRGLKVWETLCKCVPEIEAAASPPLSSVLASVLSYSSPSSSSFSSSSISSPPLPLERARQSNDDCWELSAKI